jgi:hypothetical protein
MGLIDDNLKALEQRISRACDKYGRQRNEITVLAVTKTVGAEKVKEAINAGLTHFGENRVQEAANKIPMMEKSEKAITWHMIGHLQTNKVKQALKMFDVIESVDTQKLARVIAREAENSGQAKKILLEVNSSGETSKFGFDPRELTGSAKEINRMAGLELCGLMTVGPWADDSRRIDEAFNLTRDLFVRLKADLGDKIKILSMGMSADLEHAIKYGATELRIGSAIFGPKETPAITSGGPGEH